MSRRLFTFAGLFAVGLLLLGGPERLRAADQQTLEIITKSGVRIFAVEIAVTNEERARGLMYRKELAEGRGMLFDFTPDQKVVSGMQIPHTIYLMDANGEMTNPFGKGFGDGDPDGTAWPIPGTMSPVWSASGPQRAQMLMTLRDEKGVATPGEPRRTMLMRT